MFFLFPMASCSFCLLGSWRPANLPEVVIHIQEQTVIGVWDQDKSVEMDIQKLVPNKIELKNMRVKQRPSDWYNVMKYKSFLGMFQKIKQYGLLCQLSFLDNDNVVVEPTIGKESFKFLMFRIEK